VAHTASASTALTPAGKTTLANDLADMLRGRGQEVDLERFGTPEVVERRYRRRYLPAQAIYLATEGPDERADFVVENDNPADPRLRVRSTAR
jgi:hypothetical protein